MPFNGAPFNVAPFVKNWLTGEPGSGLRAWATAQKWATWATAKKWAYVGVGVGLRLAPQDLHQQCTTAQGHPRLRDAMGAVAIHAELRKVWPPTACAPP